jgi:hypothetical protein
MDKFTNIRASKKQHRMHTFTLHSVHFGSAIERLRKSMFLRWPILVSSAQPTRARSPETAAR